MDSGEGVKIKDKHKYQRKKFDSTLGGDTETLTIGNEIRYFWVVPIVAYAVEDHRTIGFIAYFMNGLKIHLLVL